MLYLGKEEMNCLPMNRYTPGHAMPTLEKKEADVWCYSVRRQAGNGRFKHPSAILPDTCLLPAVQSSTAWP